MDTVQQAALIELSHAAVAGTNLPALMDRAVTFVAH